MFSERVKFHIYFRIPVQQTDVYVNNVNLLKQDVICDAR